MVFPNELVFVLMIVTEGLVLHSKYKENVKCSALYWIQYLLFKGTDFDWDGLLQKSQFC